MKIETLDTISNVAGKVTTISGFGGAVAFVLNNLIGLIGVLVALVGLLVNIHYKRKADKRREQEFLIDTQLKKNADRRFEEWQKFRMESARQGLHVPPITDFGALAPAAGPWSDGSREEREKRQDEEDGNN